ncbi:MAG: glycosyltransferase family 2 protein [Roseococcus sp.]|nr:glycosyltransferase family 2 protein [Roseococcus sp.]
MSASFQALRRAVAGRSWLRAALLPLFKRAVAARFALARLPRRPLFGGRIPDAFERAYRRRLRADAARVAADHAAIVRHIAALPRRPRFSVFLFGGPAPSGARDASVASLAAQLWPEWELLPTDDPQAALQGAPGDWVVLLRAGARLAPEALYEFAVAALEMPGRSVLYADEDRLDPRRGRCKPTFRPAFDPDALCAVDHMRHLAAFRRQTVLALGGLRSAFAPAETHDLALRVLAAEGRAVFHHIPAVLCHAPPTTSAEDRAHSEASRRAVRAYLAAIGTRAEVDAAPLAPLLHRISPVLTEPPPLVSVIIPTRDRAGLLRVAVEGLLHRTDYPALELLVVDNDSREPETHALFADLGRDSRVRVLSMPGPFNYPQLNNAAAAEARGEFLLLLNNDTEVIHADWLRRMVAKAADPAIGAVGPRLLYSDGRLQHGGVVTGIGVPRDPIAVHLSAGNPGDDPGPFGWTAITREVSAVTGACLLVRRAHYFAVGGMDAEALRVAFNDVDLCLKLRAAGLRNLYVGEVSLFHLESASRGTDDRPDKRARFHAECATMRARWAHVLDNDPFWNPNLDPLLTEPWPARRSRRPKPWAAYLPGG